jgi:hypothetical protein
MIAAVLIGLLLWLAAVVGGGYLEAREYQQRFEHPRLVPIVVATGYERRRLERYERCELPVRDVLAESGSRVTVSVRGGFAAARRVELLTVERRPVAAATLRAGVRAWRLPRRLRPNAYTLVVRSGRLTGMATLFVTGGGATADVVTTTRC